MSLKIKVCGQVLGSVSPVRYILVSSLCSLAVSSNKLVYRFENFYICAGIGYQVRCKRNGKC